MNFSTRLYRILCLAVFSTSLCPLLAQEYVPDAGDAFLPDEVATVRVTVSQEDWDFILNPDNAYSNIEWPATFVYESSMGTDTVTNVGFRLRGNTSRTAAKKSFKVSFNSFVAGAKWNGLEKLNLNGNHNDPSMLRARMVWEYMRDQGYIAPRVSHVKVYVNDDTGGVHQCGTRGRRIHPKAVQTRPWQPLEVHVPRRSRRLGQRP